MNICDLQTGDIVLVSNYEKGMFNLFLDMIRYGTHSDYVHIGMIVKDPQFTEKPLSGTFFWESSYEGTPDPQDGKVKLGVQMTPIEDLFKNYSSATFYVRKFNDYSLFTEEALKEVHDIAYCKPYDINPRDWILALFQWDPTPQLTNRFWCSAFVGLILTKVGILEPETDWTIMRPCDFALDGENLNYNCDVKLLEEEFKLLEYRKPPCE
tara:strand:+ start:303 stop:932 length:630 start_codon:yes stop_codon:yes gene_type:complete